MAENDNWRHPTKGASAFASDSDACANKCNNEKAYERALEYALTQKWFHSTQLKYAQSQFEACVRSCLRQDKGWQSD
ncbi:MAG: hypothetical protein AB7E47_08575 [Desulfovibrionaceae bacterium]